MLCLCFQVSNAFQDGGGGGVGSASSAAYPMGVDRLSSRR